MHLNFLALAAIPRVLRNPLPTQQHKRRKRSLSRDCICLAILYTAIYFALSPMVAMPLYKLLLFPADRKEYSAVIAYPIKQLHDQLGVVTEEFYFSTPDEHKLYARYFVRPGAKKVFLVSHGNGGNIDHAVGLAAALLCCDASVFTYDYEGYGKSDGTPGLKASIADGVAAYDCLTHRFGYQPKDIILYGASLGTAITMQISRVRPAKAIVLQSGFSSLLNVGKEALLWLSLYPPSWFDGFENGDNSRVVARPHAPLLILHGDADLTCKVHHAIDLYKAAREPKRLVILHGCGHIFGIDNPGAMEFLKAIKQFIDSLK